MSYYRYHVFFCSHLREEGRACCGAHQASELRDYTKAQIKALKLDGKGGCRVNKAGCFDRCYQAPVLVVYPDAVWYRYDNQADIDEIIESHLQNGQIVERLRV